MRILFQGDSITDANRDYKNCHYMGTGYAYYASELIKARHPGTKFEFINLGINGNQTRDLVDRWTRDCIDVKPDMVSILIGINDVWHYADNKEWLKNDIFENNYRVILERTKKETDAKIMMIEPFLLPVSDKLYFREDLNGKIDIVRKLAREYADVFVPLDGEFAAAIVGNRPRLFACDGVHPSEAGSIIIANKYANAFDNLFELLNQKEEKTIDNR